MALANARNTSSLPGWLLDPNLEDMATMFAVSCREYGTRPAYRVNGDWITYADCAARVTAVSLSFNDFLSEYRERTGKQAVIAVLLPNCHVTLESFFVAALTRSIVFPINHRLIPSEIENALRASGATVLLTSNAFKDTLSEITWNNVAVSTIVWTDEPVELPVRDQRSWNKLLSGSAADHVLRPTSTPDTFLQGFNTSARPARPRQCCTAIATFGYIHSPVLRRSVSLPATHTAGHMSARCFMSATQCLSGLQCCWAPGTFFMKASSRSQKYHS